MWLVPSRWPHLIAFSALRPARTARDSWIHDPVPAIIGDSDLCPRVPLAAPGTVSQSSRAER